LIMSIRSRLATELSYALTTFTMLSSLKTSNPTSGFPISHCLDLLDEVIDLIEDEAFGGTEDGVDAVEDCRVTTHRELVNKSHEDESFPFAGITRRQGTKDPHLGPCQRPGNVILAITNIVRNLSSTPDNISSIASNERVLDVMLRTCCVVYDGDRPHPASAALSLSDLVIVRKDTLYTLSNLVGQTHFPPNTTSSSRTAKIARRAFNLVASYLTDPTECPSPMSYLQQNGLFSSGRFRPPSLADIALEVLTRLSLTDSNRQVLSLVVPQTAVWRLFEALIHRLPLNDDDFALAGHEVWLSYVEKLVMGVYSLAFLAPPELKLKIKKDRSLGFTKVMLRMMQKFLATPQVRMSFAVCARRAMETMKVVDDGKDSFDTSQSATLPVISFGMGYGEFGESEKESGTGLLGGHRDVAWDLLMLREMDDVMFSTLESLARVD
jgi:SWI/SNF chromatin-remodeling complex subunit SWI1